MISALLVSSDKSFFMDLTPEICKHIDLAISRATSGKEALSMMARNQYILLVTDEFLVDMTGLELIEFLVRTNPTVHCAVVSSLSRETFHDASEGLGILMQMPPRPEKSQMENLLQQVNRIFKKSI